MSIIANWISSEYVTTSITSSRHIVRGLVRKITALPLGSAAPYFKNIIIADKIQEKIPPFPGAGILLSEGETMSYAIYLRKSQADLEAEASGAGETLSRHRMALLELAKRMQLEIGAVYEEIVSGETIAARPRTIPIADRIVPVLRALTAGRTRQLITMNDDRFYSRYWEVSRLEPYSCRHTFFTRLAEADVQAGHESYNDHDVYACPARQAA